MKRKRSLVLALGILLCLSLCACDRDKDGESVESGYTVALRTAAGSGFYWDCTLSKDGIVTVTSEDVYPEQTTAGSDITTNYRFIGKRRGEVTASFRCAREWDDSVYYLQSCTLTVDWDHVVSGELSAQTAVIYPGEGSYTLALSDSGAVLWTEEEDGSFTFTPQRDGVTTLSFTSEEDETEKRVFNMSVAEDGQITLEEDTSLQDVGSYRSVEEMGAMLGFSMPVPGGAELNEISSVGTMGYVNFTWDGVTYAYVGGALDLSAFSSADTKHLTVSGCEILLPDGMGTTAAWERDGIVYYISAEESLPAETVEALLKSILK